MVPGSLSGSGSRLVLASGSTARRDMMRSAGLLFEVMTADVDESAVRSSLLRADPAIEPEEIAAALAGAKARAVSLLRPEAVVIGSDQVLALGLEIIAKARTMDAARATLMKLKGNLHHLHSAAAIAENGKVKWSHVETAAMRMRNFSPEWLGAYLGRAGEEVLGSVGCYHYEGLGVQLFEEAAGDHYTILGMPLLAVLAELRRMGVLAT